MSHSWVACTSATQIQLLSDIYRILNAHEEQEVPSPMSNHGNPRREVCTKITMRTKGHGSMPPAIYKGMLMATATASKEVRRWSSSNMRVTKNTRYFGHTSGVHKTPSGYQPKDYTLELPLCPVAEFATSRHDLRTLNDLFGFSYRARSIPRIATQGSRRQASCHARMSRRT